MEVRSSFIHSQVTLNLPCKYIFVWFCHFWSFHYMKSSPFALHRRTYRFWMMCRWENIDWIYIFTTLKKNAYSMCCSCKAFIFLNEYILKHVELNVRDVDPNNLTRELWNRLKLQSEHLNACALYLWKGRWRKQHFIQFPSGKSELKKSRADPLGWWIHTLHLLLRIYTFSGELSQSLNECLNLSNTKDKPAVRLSA